MDTRKRKVNKKEEKAYLTGYHDGYNNKRLRIRYRLPRCAEEYTRGYNDGKKAREINESLVM